MDAIYCDSPSRGQRGHEHERGVATLERSVTQTSVFLQEMGPQGTVTAKQNLCVWKSRDGGLRRLANDQVGVLRLERSAVRQEVNRAGAAPGDAAQKGLAPRDDHRDVGLLLRAGRVVVDDSQH
jgi:hypothetical protein